MMALLFLWTVIIAVWYEAEGYGTNAMSRTKWHWKLFRIFALGWLVYGTVALTFLAWEYLP